MERLLQLHYKDITSNSYTEDTIITHNSDEYKNTIAKDIESFKKSTKDNGGYYIARYEASYGRENKALSKPSIKAVGGSSKPSSYSNGDLWNWITQPEAVIASQAMYENNSSFSTDLVNSYAWDTAIIFIQKYSGKENYSRQQSKNTSETVENTGQRIDDGEDNTTDQVCNIYDMASNCYEWTTETYSDDNKIPCVNRGGGYPNNGKYTSTRSNGSSTHRAAEISFRVVLYVD